MKVAFKGTLKLSRPDFSQPFTLQTDTHGVGIVAVLYRGDESRRRSSSMPALGSARPSSGITPTSRKAWPECGLARNCSVPRISPFATARPSLPGCPPCATPAANSGSSRSRHRTLPGKEERTSRRPQRLPTAISVPAGTIDTEQLLPPVPTARNTPPEADNTPAASCVRFQTLQEQVRETQRQDPEVTHIINR